MGLNLRLAKMPKGNPGAEGYLVLKLAFSTVDKKKTGKINVSQFKEVLKELAGDDKEDMLKEVVPMIPDLFVLLDADEDGKLTERELCSLAMYGSTSNLHNLLMTAMIYAADKDNNGWINAAELKEMLLKLSPEDEKDSVDEMVKMLMMMITTDDETKVSIDAVVDFFVKGPEDDRKATYKMMFRMMDLNKDGTISKKELAKYFNMEGGLEDFVLKEMMKEADKDKDGKLNFAEFLFSWIKISWQPYLFASNWKP